MEMVTFGSTSIASSYYQVKVGGDAAALKGIMKALIALDAAAGPGSTVLDHEFIAAHTHGYEAFAAGSACDRMAGYQKPPADLPQAALEAVAQAYAKSNATIVTYGMGITQHSTGTSNVHQIANLLLLRGNFGKPGAGICPLRGHSNVQGDRTVGITEQPIGGCSMDRARRFGFKPPQAARSRCGPGHAGDHRWAFQGADMPGWQPDRGAARCGPHVSRPCETLDLAVHIGTKLNRTHLLVGKESILFPCLGRTEQDMQAGGPQSITVEDSMSMVHASRGKLPPASEHLRSEIGIIAGMAHATLTQSKVDWRAWSPITTGSAMGSKRSFRTSPISIPHPQARRLSFVVAAYRACLADVRQSGIHRVPGLSKIRQAGASDVLKLTTLRSHDQYNTTIYGLDDRYRGVFGRRDVIFMSEDDLAAQNLEHGDIVDVELRFKAASTSASA